jgi:glutamine cyclotransferase
VTIKMMTKDRPLTLKDRPLTLTKVLGIILFVLSILSVLSVQSCLSNPNNPNNTDNNKDVPVFSYKVVNIYPHDPTAFTQGLAWEDGYLYESAGLYGSSSLRKLEPETGKVMKNISLADKYFAEGITIYNDKIFQLTWQEQIGFVYNKNTFQLIGTFSYPHQGWGITNDNEHLIISDGSPVLHFLNPDTLKEVKQVSVYDGLYLIHNINELEYIQGHIFANIWQTDKIAIIAPETGKVVSWLDLSGILDNVSYNKKDVDVLNGIAYDEEDNRLFVTGKFWPALFEIEIKE